MTGVETTSVRRAHGRRWHRWLTMLSVCAWGCSAVPATQPGTNGGSGDASPVGWRDSLPPWQWWNDGGADAVTMHDAVMSCVGVADMRLCNVVTDPDRAYDVCAEGECVSPGCWEPECNTTGPHFRLPPSLNHTGLQKTGDAEPIVVDTITNLQWTSCGAGLRGSECDQGSALLLGYEDALTHCDGLVWGGHDDWYLPDAHELMSMTDLSITTPRGVGLSPIAFPNQAAIGSRFWSTTVMRSRRYLVTASGTVDYDTATRRLGVLCVRRGVRDQVLPLERFVRHNTQVGGQRWFEDRVTGLDFQGCMGAIDGTRCDNQHRILAEDAPAYCETLTWGGFDDWRLATYKEVQSLFSYRAASGRGIPTSLIDRGSQGVILVEHGPLFSFNDSMRVGIGVPSTTYPAVCVRNHH